MGYDESVRLMFVAFVAIAIGGFILKMSLDKKRIANYIQQQNGRIMSINWSPLGKGWFGEREERIYEVVYYDKVGDQHFATCKTSLLTGVYWTDDRISHSKSKWYDELSPNEELHKPLISQIPREVNVDEAEELHRLREENARLREQFSKKETS